MTQTSFPFEDEDTTETQFSRWARNIGEGVVPDANGDALTVTVGTGLAVDVDPGQCLVRGHYYTSTAVESLSLATADASDPRLDTVVLRLDPTANSVVLAVVVGSPAAVPTAPGLTQTDAGVYELPLANVLVPANSGVPSTVTDRRVFARRLGELSDVSVSSPSSGEALVYDGTEWVNDSVAATLGDLTDTDINSPSSGEVLTYDGADWVNDGLPDATPSSPGVVTGTTSDGSNTALGDGALGDNTTASDNTAVGRQALALNTTGDDNTAVGKSALEKNTTGANNTAVGTLALFQNIEGDYNTALGRASMQNNTTGTSNVAVGWLAGFANTTGNDNVIVGRQALDTNETGGSNVAIGRSALFNSTVSNLVAVGKSALEANTTGDDNTAVGFAALLSNTTGSDNTAVGFETLRDNTTGNENTAIGRRTLSKNTTGIYNTAVGRQALSQNTTGNRNTVLGRFAGTITTTGSNNSTLGGEANPSSATADNQVTLGNANITSLRCNQTSISSLSDVRDKTDIETTALGLEVINKVRPVEFTWARRDGTMGNTPDLGFIAQELAEVEDDLGETDRLRLTLRDNPEKLEAAPNRLLPVLVKAVQELSEQNDELRARIETLEAK